VHYFYLMAVVAQAVTLGGILIWTRSPLRCWMAASLALSGTALMFVPWVPTLLENVGRSEDSWLQIVDPSLAELIAPVFQMLAGWVITVIMLPVEQQPTWVIGMFGTAMFLFGCWLARPVYQGWRQNWSREAWRLSTSAIALYVGCVLLEMFGVVYILQRDLTLAPRYNFLFYPGLCVLLAACLVPSRRSELSQRRVARPEASSNSPQSQPRRSSKNAIAPVSVIVAGLVSWLFLISGLTFHRPFLPDQVAEHMLIEPTQPLVMVVGYRSLQELALGLSFALEVRDMLPAETASLPEPHIAFIHGFPDFNRVWLRLAGQPQPLTLAVPPPLNLWVVGTRAMRQAYYPPEILLNTASPAPPSRCWLDPDHYDRIGYPYQLYRCGTQPN
jgi:hypothetical protein